MADANVTMKIVPIIDPKYLDTASRVQRPESADVRYLVSSLMSQLEISAERVSEIVLYPGSVEVRYYLVTPDGKKYIWGAEGDPGRNLMAENDPRRGKVAEEVRVYRTRTYDGGDDGDHATADHPVLQDPDGEGEAPDREDPGERGEDPPVQE